MTGPRPPCALFASGVLACSILLGSAAHASGVAPGEANAAQKKEAMAHFTVGKRAAESKNWEEAEVELRKSLDVVDSPNARLMLSRALRDSGKLGVAWTEYGRTMDTAAALSVADPRYTQTADAARTEQGELEPKLAFVTITVQHAPPDATLKVGGRLVPHDEWTAPVVVASGAVDVVLTGADGKELTRKTVPAAVGEKTPVELEAQPPPPVVAPPPPSKDDVPPERLEQPKVEAPSNRASLRPYAYVAGGVGVAGLALFGIFGAMEKSTFSSLQSSCPGNVCPPDKSSDISSGKSQQLVANVALGVGIAGVAAGATLFVLSLGGHSSSTPAAGTALVVSPNFVGLRGAL